MIKSGNIIKIDHAKIRFKNFAGIAKSNMDREGDRKFTLVIPVRDAEDERILQEMVDEGYFVSLKPSGNGEEQEYRVTCHLGKYDPEIYKHVGDSVVVLTEETVAILDRDYIIDVDLGLKGSPSKYGNGMGLYVEVMHAFVEESDDEEIISDMRMAEYRR